ncbi:MAG: hypothetical protein HN591_04400 [Flavobacteriales bacterium]|jgi:hypothetical protein|nr:hypothetical protein [Flavobacteriales bacterium]
MKKNSLVFALVLSAFSFGFASNLVPIKIHKSSEGAPITLGIPFAKGELFSPDNIRLLDKNGIEIPSQTTEVTSWAPLDNSIKWVWVFFFSTGDQEYQLEYGEDVKKAPLKGPTIRIKNAQRKGQTTIINTGPLQFNILKGKGGFIDEVLYDIDQDGFDKSDQIASSVNGRGSFLDLLDAQGIDPSYAVVNRTVREKGSGPLHSIIRMEGEYSYTRDDNRNSPFIIRVHVYAGKTYIKVLHTMTYTGVPDMHNPSANGYNNIALGYSESFNSNSNTDDKGWTKPNDQIHSMGLNLNYNLKEDKTFTTAYKNGEWGDFDGVEVFTDTLKKKKTASIFQEGPKLSREVNSTPTERIEGFSSKIHLNAELKKQIQRGEGWADIQDNKWGISIGIKNFFKEYPKEISFNDLSGEAIAYLWSPKASPMSFERGDTKPDQGMIANFAEGITKTSELVIHFHKAKEDTKELASTMEYFLDPPIASADPAAYSNSGVYGHFSPRSDENSAYERSIDYKFHWQLFNQDWEPWYGMFDYGDQKNIFYKNQWIRWQNNEPAIDFMYWLQFMRTGNPKYYTAAEAMSRHTMDVDNVHWPKDPEYFGDTNDAIDFWKIDNANSTASKATPYLGIGRRHASQHWTALLSAHVWVQGWIASYYLTGYHRGLEIARLTADSYLKKLWGEHGLTGRRLYLSVWNMVEAWDATKDPRYLNELEDRVQRMLNFQNGADQYDSFVIDRYGYSQVYASHGLYKYYQLTQKNSVKQGLIRHARAVRDNPPYNHEYESLMSTIHSLLVGYELTKNDAFLNSAIARSKLLQSDPLEKNIMDYRTQESLGPALLKTSRLPDNGVLTKPSWRFISNWNSLQGLRVFGWTHYYSIPWLQYWINHKTTE